jgi:hypothetical protein
MPTSTARSVRPPRIYQKRGEGTGRGVPVELADAVGAVEVRGKEDE